MGDEGRESKLPEARREAEALRAALATERCAHGAERRNAQRWEREAVLRVSSVAGALTSQVAAAHRLASTVERALRDGHIVPSPEVADALRFFREVEKRGGGD